MSIFTRMFAASPGQKSEGNAGPDAIETDLDAIGAILNKGIGDDNLSNRTLDDSIADAYANTGTVGQMLSWFAKMLKTITGMTSWYASPPDSLKGLDSRLTTGVESLSVHKTSGDHDARYSKEWRDSVATYQDLPIAENNLRDKRMVVDAADIYTCIAITGSREDQWLKISDIDLINELAGNGRTTETVKGVSDALITHKSGVDHDARYYSRDEVNAMVIANAIPEEEVFIATAGQTNYVLTKTSFVMGKNAVNVFVQGIRLAKTDITEISITEVKIPAIEAGAEVIVSLIHELQTAPQTPIYVGATPPGNPSVNSLWVDTSEG